MDNLQELIKNMKNASSEEKQGGNFLNEAGNYDLEITGLRKDANGNIKAGAIGQKNTPYMDVELEVVGSDTGQHIGETRSERFFLTEAAISRFYTMMCLSPSFPSITTNVEAKVLFDKEVEKNAIKSKATNPIVKFAEGIVTTLMGVIFNGTYKTETYKKESVDMTTGVTSEEVKETLRLDYALAAPKYKDAKSSASKISDMEDEIFPSDDEKDIPVPPIDLDEETKKVEEVNEVPNSDTKKPTEVKQNDKDSDVDDALDEFDTMNW